MAAAEPETAAAPDVGAQDVARVASAPLPPPLSAAPASASAMGLMTQPSDVPASRGGPTAAASDPVTSAATAAAGSPADRTAPAGLQAKPSISRSSDEIWKEVSKGLEPEEAAQSAPQPAGLANESPSESQRQGRSLEQPPLSGGSSSSPPAQPPAQPRRRDVRPPSPFASNDEPFLTAGIKRPAAAQGAARQEPAASSSARDADARYEFEINLQPVTTWLVLQHYSLRHQA